MYFAGAVETAEIYKQLLAGFGDSSYPAHDFAALQPWLQVVPHRLVPTAAYLQRTEGLYFDHLACLSALDYGSEAPPEARFGVVYHLTSLTLNQTLVLKVTAELLPWAYPVGTEPRLWPTVPSLTGLYGAADWHEREAFDLMGIHFQGHPDLRRLLLPDDWVGHPLQKDYQTEATYHSIAIDYHTDAG